ncbi:MAG TPA: glycosyl transferase family 2 [Treponema sp.]|nr:glycosyl transferase family 2 [Treponema sp.]
MTKPLVSIIIPVYNAEKYMNRCLDSCRAQTYGNIEVLMINDGSDDGSEEICRTYSRKDKRFITLSQENKGVSEARNNGIMHAKGKYITFADSDDWLAPDAVSEYVERAVEDKTDFVIAGFLRVINDVTIPMSDIKEDLLITREHFAECMADAPADFYYGVVWNKLYRAEIIKQHHIFFSPRFKWCEDFLFNLEYLQYITNEYCISTIKKPLYFYVKRLGSACESPLSYTKTFSMKYELLGYYRNLYKSINLYNDNKLKINTFLFAYAHDGGLAEYNKIIAKKKRDEKKSISKSLFTVPKVLTKEMSKPAAKKKNAGQIKIRNKTTRSMKHGTGTTKKR